MNRGNNIIDLYSRSVSNHPIIVIALVAVLFIIAGIASGSIGIVAQDNSDFLPEGIEEVEAFDLLVSVFGDQDSMLISIELDPEYTGSNEPRDVRDKEIIRYIDLLTDSVRTTQKVSNVVSPSSILRDLNSGVLPQSRRDIIDLSSQSAFMDSYISSDYQMALIRIDLDGVDGSEDIRDIVGDLLDITELYPKPSGILVNVAGDLAVDPQIEDQLGPDIGRTSIISFIGIILVLLILFRSLRYGIMPLTVIIIGITWALGTMGVLGINLTNATSGVISMIMGIGIDFGIQVTMRFRQEIKSLIPSEAMRTTLNNVFMPMATTTVAALLGFWAMGTGNLSFMGEFGRIMSFGVLFTFLAAITVVPAVLVVSDQFCNRFSKVCKGPVDYIKKVGNLKKLKHRKKGGN